MSIEVLSLLLGAMVVGLYALSIERRRRALNTVVPAAPPLTHYPSLSIIRPVKGLDPGAADNVAAALNHGYPGEMETLFIFDDERDPGLPAVRAAIAAYEAETPPDLQRGRVRVLMSGPPQAGRTGKLNAMIVGSAAARGELIGFADSDIRTDQDTLRGLVALLMQESAEDPSVGDIFAPVSVSEPAQAAGDVGYALMLNALYAPEVRLWTRRGGLPFIMGQLMIFRREALVAIGGLESNSGQLVDDMHIGQSMTAAGYRNITTTHPVRIIEWGVGLTEFARIYRRWIMFSRSGIPMLFSLGAALPYVAFWAGALSAVVAILGGHPLAAIMPALLSLTAGGGLLVLNGAAGGAPVPLRWMWVPYLVLLAGPFIVLSTLLWPEVRWRGRTYAVDGHARLAADPPA